MLRFQGLLGIVAILTIAWLLSENRRRMNWRLIASGMGLQVLIAVFFLWTPPGEVVREGLGALVKQAGSFSDAGAEFVFGEGFRDHFVAFSVLPTIIFMGALMAVLFHLGVLQWIVKGMARVMVWVMDTSGSESLAAAAEVFVGMTESPLVIRPYLATMTRSELMAMMTAGMGTVAGGVMAAYAHMGIDGGHLVAASIMSAAGSLVIAKIMVPETETSVTKGVVKIDVPRQDVNVLDAACRGATDGLKLALNVAAMLIAFIALVSMLNWLLGLAGPIGGSPLSLERMLGWVGAPFAWLVGIEWNDAQQIGSLLGKKIIFNEFLAYQDLIALQDQISPRSRELATYMFCGFANFGSVAVLIGGVSSLVPSRRADFARLGPRAMIGGALATALTAAIVGILM